jgi:hypothetical protein
MVADGRHTGQHRSDVVRMAWDDVCDGMISVVPVKTKRTSHMKLRIPIHPNLAAVLDVRAANPSTILQTSFGKPFSNDGFGNYTAQKIEMAGLPARCVTHGLR